MKIQPIDFYKYLSLGVVVNTINIYFNASYHTIINMFGEPDHIMITVPIPTNSGPQVNKHCWYFLTNYKISGMIMGKEEVGRSSILLCKNWSLKVRKNTSTY